MTAFYGSEGLTPDRSIGFYIRRIERLMTARAEPLFADSAISFSQWVALFLIRHRLADSCSSLSRSLGHNSGATTRSIDQLEQRGLLTRCRGSDDRRVVTVTLTPAGDEMVARLTPRMAGFWNEILTVFERDEVDTLLALLARLMTALEKPNPAETMRDA